MTHALFTTKALALAALLLPTLACAAETLVSTDAAQNAQYVLASIPPGKIFTYFFVMLGPIKLIGPFVKMTGGMDKTSANKLAVKGFVIACITGMVAATVGQKTLASWGVSLPALLVAAGLVLLLVALQTVLAQYEPRQTPMAIPADALAPTDKSLTLLAMSPLAFPSIISPYGIAILILLLAAEPRSEFILIFTIFMGVMAINLLAMFFARPILKYAAGALMVLGAVLGVLQVALAVEILLLAARMLGLLGKLGG